MIKNQTQQKLCFKLFSSVIRLCYYSSEYYFLGSLWLHRQNSSQLTFFHEYFIFLISLSVLYPCVSQNEEIYYFYILKS